MIKRMTPDWAGEANMATGHFLKTVVDEMTTTEESSTEVCALCITSFRDMPLIVLSAGHEDPIPSLSVRSIKIGWKS